MIIREEKRVKYFIIKSKHLNKYERNFPVLNSLNTNRLKYKYTDKYIYCELGII